MIIYSLSSFVILPADHKLFCWFLFFCGRCSSQCCHHHGELAHHAAQNFHRIFSSIYNQKIENCGTEEPAEKFHIPLTGLFLSTRYACSSWFFYQHHLCVDHKESHTQTSVSCLKSLLPSELSCMVTWDHHVMSHALSLHLTTHRGLLCWPMISPFCSLLAFTILSICFLFILTVPTQLVSCDFRNFGRPGELW